MIETIQAVNNLHLILSVKCLKAIYIGPGGFREFWGYPKKVESSKDSHDEEVAEKLWSISTDLTQVHYHF